MNCEKCIVIGALLGWVMGILVMWAFMLMYSTQLNDSIIEHGCAQYNSITGDFEWKDEINITKTKGK